MTEQELIERYGNVPVWDSKEPYKEEEGNDV